MDAVLTNYLDSLSTEQRQRMIDLINNASSLEQLPIPLQLAIKSKDALARVKLESLIGKEIPRGVNQTLYQQRVSKEKARINSQLDRLIESQDQAPVPLDQVKLLQFYRKTRPDLIEKLEAGDFADPELNHVLGSFDLNSLRQTLDITNIIERLGPINERLYKLTRESLDSELILSGSDKKFMRFFFPDQNALITYMEWFTKESKNDNPLSYILFKANPGQLRLLFQGFKIGRNDIDMSMRIVPRLSHYWQELNSIQKQTIESRSSSMPKRVSETALTPTENLRIRNLKKTLQHDGYAVVENVLSPEQCAAYVDAMWTWIEGFDTGINRRYPLTWTSQNWPFTTHGLLQHFKVGQTEFAWRMRVEPEILKIFSSLWSCPPEDLIVSFDGVNMGRATTRVQGTWIHLDQGPRSSELRHYQGCVTLTTTDGGLVFYDKSPALHSKFWREHMKKDKGKDWYKFNPEDEEWYKRQGSSKVFVPSVAGSLVLWDSRVPHQGQLPTQPGQIRMCIYVCYKPRSTATPSILKKRIKTFTERRMTNHMPDDPKLFTKTHRVWPGQDELLTKFPDQPTIRDDQVTPLMRRLIGF